MTLRFSFVIPSYNAARYLKDCLDSIYSLDLGENQREVIVVNDGSTDDTDILLSDYKNRNNGLIVINQENRGLSIARNVGLQAANGEYVYFVDADDVLKKVDFSKVTEYAEQGIDVIGIDIVQREQDGTCHAYKRYDYIYNNVYSPAASFMNNKNLMPCVFAYIFRREFLVSNSLFFTPGIYHEDEDFTPRVFASAKSFVAVRLPLYERILRCESITTTTDRHKQHKRLHDMVGVIKRLDSMHIPSMQCKLDYLAVDTLRLLIRQKHSTEVKREIIESLREIGYFPLHWRLEPKHILFNTFTRIMFYAYS